MSDKIRVFYDGTCGMCHGFVRFALLRLRSNQKIMFSPLGGKAYQKVSDKIGAQRIDSIVVYDEADESIRIRGAAVVFLMKALQPPWPRMGSLLSKVPLLWVNFGYNCVARVRHMVSNNPKKSCPMVPQHLQKYFED